MTAPVSHCPPNLQYLHQHGATAAGWPGLAAATLDTACWQPQPLMRIPLPLAPSMLPTAPPPSYRVVPMGDSVGASRALAPTVHVVELARPRVAWEVGTELESAVFM